MEDEICAKDDLNYINAYLIVFAQEHVNFRVQELQSICSIFAINLNFEELVHDFKSPFLIVYLCDESAAKNIASRSVLIKSILKLYATGRSVEELHKILKNYSKNQLLSSSRGNDSFKINVESFNKKLTQEQKICFIQDLSFLPLDGDVNLKTPETTFSLLMDYTNGITGKPTNFYFGRQVAIGQRSLIKQYSLKTRHFIGNTSMDPQLSLLMANMAKCKNGTLVYDPFVGTGSILVACSHFGAHSFGSDIDRTLLLGRGHPSRAKGGKWRGSDESVFSNFRMYNLQNKYVDVFMGDQNNTALRKTPLFDAIITDPPYGIREGSKKLVVGNSQDANLSQERGRMPSVDNCVLSEALYNLLQFAARYLVLNARLVYWLPIYRSTFNKEQIPSHPCLTLLHNSEQMLSAHVSRRLITMEKTAEWTGSEKVVVDENLKIIHDRFREDYFSPGKHCTSKT